MSMLRCASLVLVCVGLAGCPEHAPSWYGFTGAELSGSTGSSGEPEPGEPATSSTGDRTTGALEGSGEAAG